MPSLSSALRGDEEDKGENELETLSWFQKFNSQREGFSDRGLVD